MSFAFAYSKSNVLLSLVRHLTYCVKVGRVEDRDAWLKSPEMRRKDHGCKICSSDTTVFISSQVAAASADGGDIHRYCDDVRGLPW